MAMVRVPSAQSQYGWGARRAEGLGYRHAKALWNGPGDSRWYSTYQSSQEADLVKNNESQGAIEHVHDQPLGHGPQEELQQQDARAPQAEDKKLAMIFTCGQCNTRAVRQFSRLAYEEGVVLVECPGCESRHLIADRYGWFGSPGSIEDFLAERDLQGGAEGRWEGRTGGGQAARFKRVEGDGSIEVTLEDVIGQQWVGDGGAVRRCSREWYWELRSGSVNLTMGGSRLVANSDRLGLVGSMPLLRLGPPCCCLNAFTSAVLAWEKPEWSNACMHGYTCLHANMPSCDRYTISLHLLAPVCIHR